MEKGLDLFSSVNPASAQQLFSSHHLLLQDNFSLSRDNNDQAVQVVLSLTDKFLVMATTSTGGLIADQKSVCQVIFDLKFQMVKDTKKSGAQKTQTNGLIGTPICLKFQRLGYKSFSFFSQRLDILTRWKVQLQKMINRRGFHQLFKPIKKIGKGNFASVYLAERLEDKKLVAVKAFSKEATFSQEKGKESLLNQITILRKFDQENVLKLCAVFESDNSIYMTMELLEGGQLFNKIQSKHKFSNDQTKQVMDGLLKGLAHMHAEGIMHRDLKPENIMIRDKDCFSVVVVDFGLAAWVGEETHLFVRCGTPGYVAPEIINIRDMNTKSDPICDVFSAGLIFHILLMGRPIFPGRTYNQVLSQNRACDFNLSHSDYSEIPSSALQLLTRMLDKNPETRISAKQALTHTYFSGMDIEYPTSKFQIQDIPKFSHGQQGNIKPRLLNKVSICSGQESYLRALKPSLIQNHLPANSTYSSIHKSRRQSSRHKENTCQ